MANNSLYHLPFYYVSDYDLIHNIFFSSKEACTMCKTRFGGMMPCQNLRKLLSKLMIYGWLVVVLGKGISSCRWGAPSLPI